MADTLERVKCVDAAANGAVYAYVCVNTTGMFMKESREFARGLAYSQWN